ncbi:MAG: hypothetical protein CVV10_02910 [Gammaproteobacteria bacterium HGW-Gammaproteobacteria-14]|nr:MAG: hypothetical protein CVV10_02910 [Gammaproteobacteria bacterium HGW-Gammaproteobacteria-14]
MLITDSMRKRFFTSAILLTQGIIAAILFAASSVVASIEVCDSDIKTISNDQPNPDLTALVAALSEAASGAPSTLRQLRNAITELPRSPAESMLQDRARVILAAHALRDGKALEARQWLSSISTESSMAVDAGLLMAESWRIAGDNENALTWFMRVGRHFPYDIAALNGLLDAADNLRSQGHAPMAAALHDEVLNRAMTARGILDALPDDPHARADIILLSSSHLPAPLRRQLNEQILHHSPDTRNARRTSQRAEQRWHCLLRQQRDMEQQRRIILQQVTTTRQALADIDQQLIAMELQRQSLSTAMVPNDFSAEQVNLRQQLRQVSNTMLRTQAQRDFLASAQDKLPLMLNDTEQRLAILAAFYEDVRGNAQASMDEGIRRALNALDNQFRNIAAESQARQAELLVEMGAVTAQ